MKIIKYAVMLFITVIAFSFQNYAQTTDFSGHWTINESKSDFAGQPAELMYKEVIVRQSLDSLTITGIRFNSGSAKPLTISYPLNGNTITTGHNNIQKMSAAVTWDSSHRTLTRNSKYFPVDNPSEGIYESTEVWSLSADRKTLSLKRTFTAAGGSIQITAVYDR